MCEVETGQIACTMMIMINDNNKNSNNNNNNNNFRGATAVVGQGLLIIEAAITLGRTTLGRTPLDE
jgi:hypothetical protein